MSSLRDAGSWLLFSMIHDILAMAPAGGSFMGIPLTYILILGGSTLVSWLVSNKLKSRFNEHSQAPLQMSGREIAEKMLADAGISDVSVISTPGRLTDHYNPGDKTVNLSEAVYNMRNVAAAAVSAHECGHAKHHFYDFDRGNVCFPDPRFDVARGGLSCCDFILCNRHASS